MKGCIREMSFEDLDSVLEIERECFKIPWTRNMFLNILSASNTYSIVYELDETIGYALTLLQRDIIHIANIAVKEEYQHQGIGSEILSHLLHFGMSLNKKKAILEVRPSNLPAISLYEKFDFYKVGIRKRYYPDGEDALVMQREI
jgi:ribosomal-protein-alanine N-acetyltransferase